MEVLLEKNNKYRTLILINLMNIILKMAEK